VLDIKAPTHGALTAGGIAAFIMGLYLLFNQSAVQIPWVTIIALGVGSAIFFAFIVGKAVSARLGRPKTGVESLVGQTAEVRQSLDPDGMVFVEGELWKAHLEAGQASVGEEVVIVGYDRMTLQVRRDAENAAG